MHAGPFGQVVEYACRHRRHTSSSRAGCLRCDDFLAVPPTEVAATAAASAAGPCRHPSGVIVDRYDRDAGIADLFLGASCFYILGGPSLRTMPLELLARRGVLMLSQNNCPAVLPDGVRPDIWLHTDGQRKFCDGLWRDPSVLKIVPVKQWKQRGDDCLRTRDGTGTLVAWQNKCGRDMPGVLGFHRNTAFDPAAYLHEPTINRGNDKEHATGLNKKGKKIGEPNRWPHTINTMFAGVRLAYYLGIKTLYLLGAEFRMASASPYAFDQGKSKGGVRANISAYADLCVMFDGLLPYFEAAGFEIFNCTPDSNLWSFDYVPFETAIERATEGITQTLDPRGCYDGDKAKTKRGPAEEHADGSSGPGD